VEWVEDNFCVGLVEIDLIISHEVVRKKRFIYIFLSSDVDFRHWLWNCLTG